MATAPTATRRMTYEEWERLPEETEGRLHELIDGVHVVSPQPILFHDALAVLLTGLFLNAARPDALGRVHADAEVKLSPAHVLVPDVLFVRRERSHILAGKVIEGPPDIVVEILSPSTRRRDPTDKRRLYERFGVLEYWVVDPVARTITVNVLENGRYTSAVYREGDTIRTTILPGLEIDVAALFAEAAWRRPIPRRPVLSFGK